MPIKRLSLRRPDVCCLCAAELTAGTTALWNSETRSVSCTSCNEKATQSILLTQDESEQHTCDVTPGLSTIQFGEAGKSAQEMYDRLHAKREARIDARFGRFAGVVKFLTDDPQSIVAWKTGSVGERLLAKSLQENLGDSAILLNDRRVPKSKANIDHIVVASSGIWVIDAKNYSGLIQRRDVGGIFRVDERLFVGGRDRTKILHGLSWQIETVTRVLGDKQVPISSAICFTDAEWGWFAKPFAMQGVFVSGPNALARRIATPGPLTPEAITELATTLSHSLPSKSSTMKKQPSA